jgi:hypothetical protein
MKRAATLGILLASTGLAPADESALLPESRRLKAAYAYAAADPADREAQRAYLDVFPGDARTFSAVFSAEGGQLPAGREYIALLGEAGKILPEAAFEKFLKIGTAARWEPGVLDELQGVGLSLALAHPKAFAGAFAGLRPTERRHVAAFLADGSNGPREAVLGLAAKLEVAGQQAAGRLLREEAALSEAHREG